MIIPIYKKCGQTSHQLAQMLGKLRVEKATHTGTLDPAAQGVLVVLTGEDRFKKAELSNSTKIYQAEILLGIKTDTDDELGLIQEIESVSDANQKLFLSELLGYVGEFDQMIHPFSSKRIEGQSYFDLAKAGKCIPEYTQKILIEDIKLLHQSKISKEDLVKQHLIVIDQIAGDFRQSAIKENWTENLANNKDSSTFCILSVQIKCSKRTYIRSIVKELSQKTGVPATLHNLVRTQNGAYKIEDCICLVDLEVS